MRDTVAESSETTSSKRKWLVLICVNLVLGCVLWLFYFTEYSLVGTIPNILLPPAVLLLGVLTLRAGRKAPSKTASHIRKLSSLPAITGGCLHILSALLWLALAFPLGLIFTLAEIKSEKLIQQAVSPDGTRVAQVYFRGVGPYSPGNGRIFVRVRHRLFPLAEREVYFLPVSRADENTKEYLAWKDNDTLYLREKGHEVRLGLLKSTIHQSSQAVPHPKGGSPHL